MVNILPGSARPVERYINKVSLVDYATSYELAKSDGTPYATRRFIAHATSLNNEIDSFDCCLFYDQYHSSRSAAERCLIKRIKTDQFNWYLKLRDMQGIEIY